MVKVEIQFRREAGCEPVQLELMACPHVGDHVVINEGDAAWLVEQVFIGQNIVYVRVR